MEIKRHANATTTPKVRAYIQASTETTAALARELGVSETTVRRWRGRKSAQDRSHARHNLGASTSLAEEAIIKPCAPRRVSAWMILSRGCIAASIQTSRGRRSIAV